MLIKLENGGVSIESIEAWHRNGDQLVMTFTTGTIRTLNGSDAAMVEDTLLRIAAANAYAIKMDEDDRRYKADCRSLGIDQDADHFDDSGESRDGAPPNIDGPPTLAEQIATMQNIMGMMTANSASLTASFEEMRQSFGKRIAKLEQAAGLRQTASEPHPEPFLAYRDSSATPASAAADQPPTAAEVLADFQSLPDISGDDHPQLSDKAKPKD